MYQDKNQSADSKSSDLLLIVVLLFLIFFATALRDFVVSLPFGEALRYVVFAAVLGASYYIYRRRVVSYNYTLYLEEGLKRPAGTFTVERMVADKGKEALVIEPASVFALVEPGSARGVMRAGEEKKPRVRYKKLGIGANRKAHLLFYERNDKLFALRFFPSAKLAGLLLKTAMENAAARREKGL